MRCEVTQASLETYSAGHETAGLRHRGVAKGEATVVEQEPGRRKSAAPEGAFKYTVGVGDTLNSVALKHSMNVGLLKRWNKLLSPDLYPGQTLLVKPPVPQTPEQIRSTAIQEVMRGAACTMPEAAYLLEEHGGGNDAKAALEAHASAQGSTDFETAWLGRGL